MRVRARAHNYIALMCIILHAQTHHIYIHTPTHVILVDRTCIICMCTPYYYVILILCGTTVVWLFSLHSPYQLVCNVRSSTGTILVYCGFFSCIMYFFIDYSNTLICMHVRCRYPPASGDNPFAPLQPTGRLSPNTANCTVLPDILDKKGKTL